MPSNVSVASPSGVFPQTLCTAFVEDRQYVQLQSMLHDGSILRGQLATTTRRSFRLAKRLTAADVATLKTFYDARGALTPFFFYNPFDVGAGVQPGSNYDPAGNSVTGRVTVVFRNTSWMQTTGLGRTEIPDIQLVEVV